MNKPDYNGGSIVNLVASIENGLGGKSRYKPLRDLDPKSLESKNVILMLIDGLGYDFLMKNGEGTVLNDNIKGKITSVFPSSTSAAIPSLMTGLTPQEHGMTGWYSYLREFGAQIIPLKFVSRINSKIGLGKSIDIKKIFDIKPLFDRINADPYIIQKNKIIDSDFTKAAGGKAKRIGHEDLKGFFNEIEKIIKSNKKRKFIYAYYPEHDSLGHDKGIESKEIKDHFKDLVEKIDLFLKSIEGTDTTVIITADHGVTEIHKSKRIEIDDHPELKNTLEMPLAGERRFAYAYVKPSKKEQFERYVKTKLKYCCDMFKSEEFLKEGYFGLGKPHEEFLNRIGDYVIIMKDHYGIYSWLEGEERNYHLGSHGGLSEEELYVPLIIIKK